jgi:hypothetical protein
MRKNAKLVMFALLAGAGVFALPPLASAGPVTFELNYEFSQGTQPSGSPPWLTFMFEEFGNDVKLTLTGDLKDADEFISEVLFNLNPSKNPASLDFIYLSGKSASATEKGVNAFKADGDGSFDVQFSYRGGENGRFMGTEQSAYRITYPGGIIPEDFLFVSWGGGGQGVYHGAAHVQGIGLGGEDSGWIGDNPVIPAPSAVVLGALGLGTIGVARRRLS